MDLIFKCYKINKNNVSLTFTHEGLFFDSDHDKEISFDEAKKIIDILRPKINENRHQFVIEYDTYEISIKTILAQKFINDFEKQL